MDIKKNTILTLKIIATVFLFISLLYFCLNIIKYKVIICDIIFTLPLSYFVCVIFHEFAHIFSCLVTHTKISHICIFPFSYKFQTTLTNFVSFKSNSKKASAFIFISGILASLILEIVLLIITILFYNYFHLIILVINFLILLGSLFNKNGDLKKARMELE